MQYILSIAVGGKVLFTKGAESAILPFTKSGEIDKTRVHVDEFALVSIPHHIILDKALFPALMYSRFLLR